MKQKVYVLPPTVTITSPLAGASWTTGITHLITWQFTGNPGPLKIELFNASNSFIIADNLPPGASGSGNYLWKVIGLTNAPYQVRITSMTLGSITTSSPPVNITNPPIPYVKWLRPYCGNVGCYAVMGKPLYIQWSSAACGDTIDISITDNTQNSAAVGTQYLSVKQFPISGGQ